MQVGWLSRDGSPAGHLMLVGWLLLCRSARACAWGAAPPAAPRPAARGRDRGRPPRWGACGAAARGSGGARPPRPLAAAVASQCFLTRTDVTQVNLSQSSRLKGRNGRRTRRTRGRGAGQLRRSAPSHGLAVALALEVLLHVQRRREHRAAHATAAQPQHRRECRRRRRRAACITTYLVVVVIARLPAAAVARGSLQQPARRGAMNDGRTMQSARGTWHSALQVARPTCSALTQVPKCGLPCHVCRSSHTSAQSELPLS
jgi:hypothetical protein